MEFDFSINVLLGDVITKLDNRVVPQRHPNNNIMLQNRKNLFLVIDKMGDASGKAQGLYGAITGGRKLELSDHLLYVMKDGSASNGKGAVLGILKVGYKKLFVYDNHGIQHEMEPLCVLDFYVHETRQRMGLGRRLFDFMIKDKNINPRHLAVDKPSHKFSSFLAKHYNLRAEIPQVNNFVVYDGFFAQLSHTNGKNISSGKPPVYRRNDVGRQPSGRVSRPFSGNSSRPSSGNRSQNRASPKEDQVNTAIKSLRISPIPTMHTSGLVADRQNVPHLNVLTNNDPNQQPSGAISSRYSRHTTSPSLLPPLPIAGTLRKQSSIENLHSTSAAREPTPPLIRDRPPQSYYNMMNMHQDYQGRGGHLKVAQNTTSPSSIEHVPKSQMPKTMFGGYPRTVYTTFTNNDSAWTVYGVVPNHRSIASRHNAHHRLW